jgi:hypothetical protein
VRVNKGLFFSGKARQGGTGGGDRAAVEPFCPEPFVKLLLFASGESVSRS